MPGRYAATGTQTAVTATPGDSALAIEGGADQRPQIYDWTSGFGGAPADNAISLRVQRTSAAATGTPVTAEPLDAADPASRASVNEEITVEGTLAGVAIFEQIMNQRANYRWVAAPGGEIVIPATANAGVSFAAFHGTYTEEHSVSMHYVD